MQHAAIDDPTRCQLQKLGMGNAPEVVREVGGHDFRMAAKQQFLHLDHRLLGIWRHWPAGSIPMERLSAPARTREELRALMNGDLGTAAGRGDLVHLALRLIVEEALEGEVSDVLGRERYERGEGEKAGYRNGYRPGRMKTAEGAVDYSAPQVRDTPEPFLSSARAALSGRTRELERLAVEHYARGLSTRDIEDTFIDETGRRLLSRALLLANASIRHHRDSLRFGDISVHGPEPNGQPSES